jgi:multiple sugar transport system substrate-binding protein
VTASSSSTSGPITLSFWNSYDPSETAVANKLIAQFESEYPNIKVNNVYYPYDSYDQALLTAIAGGAAPDVARIDLTWVGQFASLNATVDFDNYLSTLGVNESSFLPGPWGTSLYNGKLYALPLDTNCLILFYNKALFAEYNLTPPTTWAQFLHDAEVLTATNSAGQVTRWGFSNGDWMLWHEAPFIWQAGGSFFNANQTVSTVNDSASVAAMQFVQDMIYKYKVMPSDPTMWSNTETYLAEGKIAMTIDGPWMEGIAASVNSTFASKDLGWCLLPGNVTQASVVGGEDLVIFRQTKNLAASLLLAKFMVSHEYQLTMATQSDQYPALKSAAIDPALTTNNSYYQTFVQQQLTAQSRPVSPQFTLMNDYTHQAADAIMISDEPVQTVLNQLASELDTLVS